MQSDTLPWVNHVSSPCSGTAPPCPMSPTMPRLVTNVRRKSIRLPGYDYTTGGTYFVTICAADRRSPFGRIVDETMILGEVGQLIEESWFDLPNHHPNVRLDMHVVMPNHFHGLLVLMDERPASKDVSASRDRARRGRAATVEAFGRPVAGSVPTIIRSFKAASSRSANRCLGREGKSIWQRNYYEHIIRNEEVLCRAREYIQNNPLKWALDPEDPERPDPDR